MQVVPRGDRVQPCVREREVRRANAERAAAQTLSSALGGEEMVKFMVSVSHRHAAPVSNTPRSKCKRTHRTDSCFQERGLSP